MCIIAVVPEGLHLQDEVINNMWEANSDGAGFMYAEDGQLHIQKGFMTLAAFKEAYEPHAGKKLVLHFRIKTHGETNAVNTHPFAIDDTLAFVHNGVVSGYGSKEFSDTYHLNEELLKPLRASVKNFLHIKPIEELIQEHIGYSKLVFLDNEGNTTIINESKGERSSDGIWFSNSSWKFRRSYYGNQSNMHQRVADDDDDPVGNQKKTSSANDNNGNCSDKKCLPESRTKSSATSDYFRCNDSVFLNCAGDHFKGIAKYSVGTVAWFTQGFLLAVKFQGKSEAEYIPSAYLEKIIPVKMIRPIGHLRIGDYLVFKTVDDKMTTVIDFERKKEYKIPNDSYVEVDVMKENSYNYPWIDAEYEYCE